MEKALEVMGCGYSVKGIENGDMHSEGCLMGSPGLESGGSSFPLSLQALGVIFDPIERRMSQRVAAKRAEMSLINPFAIDPSHFLMDELLGVGGFGLVRLAMRVSLSSVESPSKLYAIKTIPKCNVLAKTNGVLSVYNELNCLRSLSESPFICRAHHAFNDSRQLYLVLEFCAGGDFRVNLRKQPKGVFTESVARFYMGQCIRT
jgi:serine/threonine protein kinase